MPMRRIHSLTHTHTQISKRNWWVLKKKNKKKTISRGYDYYTLWVRFKVERPI